MSNSQEQAWQAFVPATTRLAEKALAKHTITIDSEQPHTLGERFLMQSLTTTGGQKLILLGRDTNTDLRCVIKIAADVDGIKEINDERKARSLLQNIDFNYEAFNAPREIAHFTYGSHVINVQEYIAQESPFIDRPLEMQFAFALNAFKAQEKTRATTNRHFKKITSVFGARTAKTYLDLLTTFEHSIEKSEVQTDFSVIKEAANRIRERTERIEQYCGFLTHTDFVPHNFRIADDSMYLLDFSSLCFGNKHESWARFLNFMTLYNRELETLLISYVEENRSHEERESLQLMRLYRLCEIVTYYVKKVPLSEANLKTLNEARVSFWLEVLKAELQNTRVSQSIVDSYIETRDNLRSTDEKKRQVNLH